MNAGTSTTAKQATDRTRRDGKADYLLAAAFHGAGKVAIHCKRIGPVRAALQCSACRMIAELDHRHVRRRTHSPGPLKTRAAAGLDHLDELLQTAGQCAPGHHLVDIPEVGGLATFLASDAGQRTHRQRRASRCRLSHRGLSRRRHQADSPHDGSHCR